MKQEHLRRKYDTKESCRKTLLLMLTFCMTWMSTYRMWNKMRFDVLEQQTHEDSLNNTIRKIRQNSFQQQSTAATTIRSSSSSSSGGMDNGYKSVPLSDVVTPTHDERITGEELDETISPEDDVADDEADDGSAI